MVKSLYFKNYGLYLVLLLFLSSLIIGPTSAATPAEDNQPVGFWKSLFQKIESLFNWGEAPQVKGADAGEKDVTLSGIVTMEDELPASKTSLLDNVDVSAQEAGVFIVDCYIDDLGASVVLAPLGDMSKFHQEENCLDNLVYNLKTEDGSSFIVRFSFSDGEFEDFYFETLRFENEWCSLFVELDREEIPYSVSVIAGKKIIASREILDMQMNSDNQEWFEIKEIQHPLSNEIYFLLGSGGFSLDYSGISPAYVIVLDKDNQAIYRSQYFTINFKDGICNFKITLPNGIDGGKIVVCSWKKWQKSLSPSSEKNCSLTDPASF